jgi:hypothetical protein
MRAALFHAVVDERDQVRWKVFEGSQLSFWNFRGFRGVTGCVRGGQANMRFS